MIDYEVDIFGEVYDAVIAEWPDAYVHGGVISTPASFPAVQIYERDNAVADRYRTQETDDQFVRVMFEAQTFSDKAEGANAEAKRVMAVVCRVMARLGFSRTLNQPITNIASPHIARRVARFEGIIGADGTVYRR